MDRNERGHIEYEVPRTDGDPLAEFANEAVRAEPSPAAQTPAALAAPLSPHPISSARRRSTRAKWVAAGLIGGGLAAFGAGAFVFVEYPKWSAKSVTEKTTAERPIATKGDSSAPATRNEPAPPSGLTRNSSVPGASRKQASSVGPTDSEFPSLTGTWSLNTRVESSALRRYEGLRLEYQLRLQQIGSRVTGDGYKSRENDRLVRTRTPITLSGDVVGDRVVLDFQERGTRRMSGGQLVFERESEDLLRGRFSSDAATSTGVADARR